ncbi:HxsD-like protein [Candidatus Woesearchaeota archaeon]|nr:HxsD-like protein [Candidatus Woesearchaeota archaeon]
MKRVVVENNAVILTFNKTFYPEEIIRQSMADFHDVCDSGFEGEKLVLKPKTNEIDMQKLGYEFYNYLLDLIKS